MERQEKKEMSVENEKMGDLERRNTHLALSFITSLAGAENSGVATQPVAIGAVCYMGKARPFVAKMKGEKTRGCSFPLGA